MITQERGRGVHQRQVVRLVLLGLMVVILLPLAWYFLRPGGEAAAPGGAKVVRERPDYSAIVRSTPYDAEFVMAAVVDHGGNFYVGTEDYGLYRYDLATGKWQWYMPSSSGLGENTVTALLTDSLGRVWAGHVSQGVSVFNGESWKNYNYLTGPLGGRVWDMALSPVDASVWIATDLGLAQYLPQTDEWRYYTRMDGLVCDEFSTLAFAADGTLYAGTHCYGLLIGEPQDDYRTWRHIRGSAAMPNTPSGEGLPSEMINDILVSGTGTVYVATACGLAWSTDDGQAWRFVRGENWRENVEGLYSAPQPEGDDSEALLADDWVTALAEDTDGQIRVGFYRGGQQILDPEVTAVVRDQAIYGQITKFIYALPADHGSIVGVYGLRPAWLEAKTKLDGQEFEPAERQAVAHPSPAKAPGLEELRAMRERIRELPEAQRVADLLGEDWGTTGDWISRYGRQRGIICAAQNPMDHDYSHGEPYDFRVGLGPHVATGASRGAWSWLQGRESDNPRWLWDPCVNTRRIGEWNDGSFDEGKYPITWEGPDLWLRVDLPKGVHRVSIYFLNKDGHNDNARHRDYLVQLRPGAPTIEDAMTLPVLAQTRVREFWNGVYKQMVLSEGQYWIKVQRNGSAATILNGLFFDRLIGEASPHDSLPRVGMGDVMYDPPAIAPGMLAGEDEQSSRLISAAADLVHELDGAYARQDVAGYQKPYRIMALRAATAADAHEELLANWRWSLPVWTSTDRAEFAERMTEAQSSLEGKLSQLESHVTKRRRNPWQ